LQETVGQLEESSQKLQLELQELKGVHHITLLRAEKQNEWNDRMVAELKEEIQVFQQRAKQMISVEQYKVDLEHVRAQNSVMKVINKKKLHYLAFYESQIGSSCI
jgi:hypothetical protein